jgi:hypothetical protein
MCSVKKRTMTDVHFRGEFRPLEEIAAMDPANLSFGRRNQATRELHRFTLADRHAQAAALQLPVSVPEDVCRYYDASRMLWVHGWFYYPFYTWAGLHAAFAAELALSIRIQNSDQVSRPKRLYHMREFGVEAGWFSKEGFRRLRHQQVTSGSDEERQLLRFQVHSFRELRNWQAHPDRFSFSLPSYGLIGLEFACDFIAQLFRGPDASDVA